MVDTTKKYWELKSEELEKAGKIKEAGFLRLGRLTGPGTYKGVKYGPLESEATRITERIGEVETELERQQRELAEKLAEKGRTVRYAKDEIGEYWRGIDVTALTPEEERDVRREEMEGIEQMMDRINEMYAGMIRGEEEKGERALGRTRAMMSYAGLLGGPRAGAQAEEVRGYTREQIKLLNEERAVKIATLFDRADTRAEARIRAEKEVAAGNLRAKMEYLLSVKVESQTNNMAIAESGVPLDKFKLSTSESGESYYDQALEDTGWNSLVFDTNYNRHLAEERRIDWNYTWVDNNYVASGRDPMTGEMKFETYSAEEMGLPPEIIGGAYMPEIGDDGTMVFYPKIYDLEPPEGVTFQDHLRSQIFIYGKFGKPEEITEEEYKTMLLSDKADTSDPEYPEGMPYEKAVGLYGAYLDADWIREQYGVMKPPTTEKEKTEEAWYKEFNEWLKKIEAEPDKYYRKGNKIMQKQFGFDKVVFQ